MFHEAAILIVPIFLPMFAFLHILERRFTRPIEVLALDQQTFIERMESDVEQGRRDMRIAVDERGTKPRYEIAELYESTNKMRRDMVGASSSACTASRLSASARPPSSTWPDRFR